MYMGKAHGYTPKLQAQGQREGGGKEQRMHRKPPLNRISVMVMVMVMDTKKNAHIATNEETKNEKTT